MPVSALRERRAPKHEEKRSAHVESTATLNRFAEVSIFVLLHYCRLTVAQVMAGSLSTEGAAHIIFPITSLTRLITALRDAGFVFASLQRIIHSPDAQYGSAHHLPSHTWVSTTSDLQQMLPSMHNRPLTAALERVVVHASLNRQRSEHDSTVIHKNGQLQLVEQPELYIYQSTSEEDKKYVPELSAFHDSLPYPDSD